jgi:hypothetical protein
LLQMTKRYWKYLVSGKRAEDFIVSPASRFENLSRIFKRVS